MTLDQILLAGLLGALLALFIWGRWRYDIVAFAGLIVGAAAGLVPADRAFMGFGHPATVTVALVLILSRGFQNSGAVDLIARNLMPPLKNTGQHVGLMSTVAGTLSAIMNNVGALALLMPAAIQSGAKAKRSPSVILMPLAFGSILGGLVTLIGTPPNIIVASFRGEATGTPFGMFDYTPVGAAVALGGLAFVALVGWRLIPASRQAKMSPREMFEIDNYVTEARIPKESKLVGMKLGDADDMAAEHDAVVLGLLRRNQTIGPARRREELHAGDVLVVEASPDSLDKMLKALEIRGVGERGKDQEKRPLFSGEDMALAEAVVQPTSRAFNRTADSLQLRRRFGVNLIAVSRQGRPYVGRLKNFRFETGDVMLIEGDAERLPEVISWTGCLPLAERGLQTIQAGRSGVAIGLFAAAIVAATMGIVSIPVALAIAAGAFILLSLVSAREIYDSIDWPVIVLLGSLIPIGQALDSSGATRVIAETLVGAAAGLPPVVLLTVILVLTMTLSDILNNAATAVVMAPIAMGVANALAVNADTFLMAVAVGASCAFLTPIGHQNNTLILGPGGYRFGDYWRLGLPLEILIVLIAIPMLLWIWPL